VQDTATEITSNPLNIDSLKYLKDLKVGVKINALRNTWIKSQNMAIEIRYDLEIKKEGKEPEIFGKLEIVRGTINVLGRRFDFKESYVYFDGGSYLNPRLDIRIGYTFRASDKEKRTLEIQVSDRVESPQLFFTLDGAIIEKSEAMSYLIFARSSSELSAGEQSDLNSTTNLVASYLSNRMSSKVGSKIGVDVLEVNSEDNWQSANVTVGKYISSDLYVSYAQQFGEDTEGDIVKQMITLEYELTRNILLQLVEGSSKYSGFDVIFKFTR
jgi:translocation and assembly module TamB